MWLPSLIVVASIGLTIFYSASLYEQKPSGGELYLAATLTPLLLVFSFCFRCLGCAWPLVPAFVYGVATSVLVDLDGKTSSMTDDERRAHKVMIITYPVALFTMIVYVGWTCCRPKNDKG